MVEMLEKDQTICNAVRDSGCEGATERNRTICKTGMDSGDEGATVNAIDIPDDLLNRYEALKGKVTKRREEWNALMDFVEKETSWLIAPASTRFHLCRKNGLLEHSVNVAENLLKLKNLLAPEISDESCVVVALLHDLGKAGMPGNPQYIVNEPSERQRTAGYPASKPYSFNNDLVYMSVPVRSLYLAGSRFPFTETEAQAIIYHDGQYVDDNRSVATHEEKLTLLLQYADNWSGFVMEVK